MSHHVRLDTLYKHLTLYTPRYTLCTTPKGPGAVVARHDWRERRHQRPGQCGKGPEVVVAFSTGEG